MSGINRVSSDSNQHFENKKKTGVPFLRRSRRLMEKKKKLTQKGTSHLNCEVNVHKPVVKKNGYSKPVTRIKKARRATTTTQNHVRNNMDAKYIRLLHGQLDLKDDIITLHKLQISSLRRKVEEKERKLNQYKQRIEKLEFESENHMRKLEVFKRNMDEFKLRFQSTYSNDVTMMYT